jgi:hypothetical protein
MTRNWCLLAATAGLALALSACGGDGVNTVSYRPPPSPTPAPTSTPTPTPTPTPSDVPAGAVTAFDFVDSPPDGALAVAGATAEGGLGDPQMLANASVRAVDQPQMRYDAATNTYDIRFPTSDWATLWTKDESEPDWARAIGVGETGAVMGFNLDRKVGAEDVYSYSTIAWYSWAVDRFGTIAVGVPTDASAVPTTGLARYDGVVSGETDIFVESPPPEAGWPVALAVDGTVTLSFDFAGGTLSGSMEPMLGSESLGVFTFEDGVYSAGAYSGRFNTPVSGINGFNGQLTGPHGEELIGGWALPFHYSGDNQDHQAIGAWIAKH